MLHFFPCICRVQSLKLIAQHVMAVVWLPCLYFFLAHINSTPNLLTFRIFLRIRAKNILKFNSSNVKIIAEEYQK